MSRALCLLLLLPASLLACDGDSSAGDGTGGSGALGGAVATGGSGGQGAAPSTGGGGAAQGGSQSGGAGGSWGGSGGALGGEGGGLGLGDVCTDAQQACGSGLVCCYPCGIQGCDFTCSTPCDVSQPGCSGGCWALP